MKTIDIEIKFAELLERVRRETAYYGSRHVAEHSVAEAFDRIAVMPEDEEFFHTTIDESLETMEGVARMIFREVGVFRSSDAWRLEMESRKAMGLSGIASSYAVHRCLAYWFSIVLPGAAAYHESLAASQLAQLELLLRESRSGTLLRRPMNPF